MLTRPEPPVAPRLSRGLRWHRPGPVKMPKLRFVNFWGFSSGHSRQVSGAPYSPRELRATASSAGLRSPLEKTREVSSETRDIITEEFMVADLLTCRGLASCEGLVKLHHLPLVSAPIPASQCLLLGLYCVLINIRTASYHRGFHTKNTLVNWQIRRYLNKKCDN